MSTGSNSIEQQAKITSVSGNVQLIRDGFFLPAQVGMSLLPGDRIVSDNAAKAVIQFTGVNDALVIEQGAAATFNLEVVAMDEAPQWIATDLYGAGVYFDSQAAINTASTSETPDLFGLFGNPSSAGDESTGYPVLESLVFLGATAAIYSDNEDNPDSTTTTNTNESGNGTNNPGTGTTTPPPPNTAAPDPTPEPAPEAGPLDTVVEPITGLLDGIVGTGGTSSPLGSLPVLGALPLPTDLIPL